MNRHHVVKGKYPKEHYFVNFMEVSYEVYIAACRQNQRLRDYRIKVLEQRRSKNTKLGVLLRETLAGR